MKRLNCLWVLLILLAGCAQLGLTKPQTPQDSLQYAKASLTGVYKSIANLSPTLTPAEKASYLARADKALDNIVRADKLLLAGQQIDAQSILNATVAVLTVLQTELAKQGGK